MSISTIAGAQSRKNNWDLFTEWVTSTNNRLYVGWFGMSDDPLSAGSNYLFHYCLRWQHPPVDIDGIREPVSGSLMYGKQHHLRCRCA